MKVTLDLLKEWGACQEALDWWKKDHPDGEDESLTVLCEKVIPEKYRQDWSQWFLYEVAARVEGPEGDEALKKLVEIAEGAQLAKIVMRITIRDTSAALAKLVADGGAEYLVRVLEGGPLVEAATCASALAARAPAVATYCERELKPERGALITDARRVG